MSSGIQFRIVDDPHLIKAPQGIGKGDEESKEKRKAQEFDFKDIKKIDRKIIRWMLESNPLFFLKGLLEHSQADDLLMSLFGIHEILGYALMKNALTGVAQKVLNIEGLFSKNKQERQRALVSLVLSLPAVKKSIKKTGDLSVQAICPKESSFLLSKILYSRKKSSDT
jgi:hypothetical protein